jgi:hypothetical protein
MEGTTLIKLYEEMAGLTLLKCKECKIPLSCCDPVYCELAKETAIRAGVTIKETDHKTLPFMGENGCVVPPYLRPLCTLHTCTINSLGFDPKDLDWTNRYFKLREEIEELENEFKRI